MHFCVNEFEVGVNESIFSGNEHQKVYYSYMAVAASGPNTEILQFDWLTSGRALPLLSAQGEGIFVRHKPLCPTKIKSFDNM